MSDAAVAQDEPDIKPTKKKYESIDINDVATGDEKKLSFTKTFFFEYKSPEDGSRMAGQFTCQRPTLGAIGQLGVIKARLNGGQQVHPQIDFLHEMIAYCQVTLIETPDWWNPEEFYDANILRAVYDHVRSWEDSFRKQRVG